MVTQQIEESGTFFVLPPHHRMFAVFDDPVVGSAVAEELREAGIADVWTFFGGKGIRSLDPHIASHGVPVGIVRAMQRLMTNDCEYCDGLSSALSHGAMVLAAKVGAGEAEALSEKLRRRGGHSFAYGQHWNFVPLAGAAHAVGFSPEEEAAAADGSAARSDDYSEVISP